MDLLNRLTGLIKDRATTDLSVVKLLSQLMAAKSRVDVLNKRTNRRYQSLLLDIDATTKQLTLDEPFPVEQHAFQPGDRVSVVCPQPNNRLTFECRVSGQQALRGIQTLCVSLPTRVDVVQQRGSFRVRLVASDEISVTANGVGDTWHQGSVIDLSNGGIKFSIPGDQQQDFPDRNDIRCLIQLDDGEEPIPCQLAARLVEVQRNTRPTTIIAGCLQGLSTHHQARLDKCLLALQRKRLSEEVRLV